MKSNIISIQCLILLTLIILVPFSACKKDDNDQADLNTIKVIFSDNTELTYAYSPNQGFWAQADPSTRSYWLVFGDNVTPPTQGKSTLDMFFYRLGQSTITFPSAEGQSIQFTLEVDGEVCTFSYELVTLSIYIVDDMRMTGFITGTFYNSCNNNEKVAMEMEFDISLTPGS